MLFDQLKRRDFIALLGGAAVWPLAARAQQRGAKALRIGVLDVASETINAANIAALRQGLQRLGYVEGENFFIIYRFARGGVEQFTELANELLRFEINMFVTRGTPATLAAKKATATIPIVMAASGDPVRAGLVASLARPGGNVTGHSSFLIDLVGKRLELIKEMTGRMVRTAFLDNLGNPVAPPLWEETRSAARSLNVEPLLLDVRNTSNLEAAFKTADAERADAILVGNDTILSANRPLVVALAAQYRMPALYQEREWIVAGGLVSYGVSF